MSEMIANRYLLNEKPDRAIRLYREAIRRGDDTSCNRCRLVAACLADGRSDEALGELLALLETQGSHALPMLKHECKSFLPNSTEPASEQPLIRALWLVLNGENNRAKEELNRSLQNGGGGSEPNVALLLEYLNRLNPSNHDDENSSQTTISLTALSPERS